MDESLALIIIYWLLVLTEFGINILRTEVLLLVCQTFSILFRTKFMLCDKKQLKLFQTNWNIDNNSNLDLNK